jgi:hypothetical protein
MGEKVRIFLAASTLLLRVANGRSAAAGTADSYSYPAVNQEFRSKTTGLKRWRFSAAELRCIMAP